MCAPFASRVQGGYVILTLILTLILILDPHLDAAQGGYVILTTRRIMWVDGTTSPAAGRSCSLALAAVAGCSKKVQYGLKAKIRIELEVGHMGHMAACGWVGVGHGGVPAQGHIGGS